MSSSASPGSARRSTCCCAGPMSSPRIAWIGSSFYFVFLDFSLTPPTDPALQGQGRRRRAVGGARRRLLPPAEVPGGAAERCPSTCTGSTGRATATWLTGFALFTVLYLFNASSFLVDKSVHDWSAGAAIGAALGFLVVFWFVYDIICRAFGQQRERRPDRRRAGVAVFVVSASWLACHLFAGRAAFLLVGAMMATAMSANVFFWIIPGQRKVIAQMKAGAAGGPDPRPARQAAQRAQHLLHAAGADRDAVQPLRLAVPGARTTGWCWC